MNKLYLMCFYESNVRYFHLAKSLFEKKGCEIVILCMYPSAVKYCKKNELKYVYLPKEVRKEEYSKKIDIDSSYYSFHTTLLPSLEKEYIKVSAFYFNYYEQLLKSDFFYSLIVIGDIRLFSSTAKYWANKLNKKIFYFEPGAFSTMIFDPVGVNKNMSISQDTLEYIESYEVNNELLEEFLAPLSGRKYYEGNFGAYFRKIKDVLLSVPPEFMRSSFPCELQTGEGLFESIPYLFSRLISGGSKSEKVAIPEKFILFPLQVPNDVQIIENSPNFESITDMVKAVGENLPEGYKVLVREHPMNKGRYDKALYDYLNSHPDVILDNDNYLFELIDKSDLVVINNSTVGVEALKTDTEVLVLGESYYHQVVHCYDKTKNIKDVIEDAIKNPISRELKDKFLTLIFEKYLVKDNYKNKTYLNLDKMVNKLTEL
ncbi:hypothetical protein AB6C93_22855 [Vibrio splendidus]